ncbi:hypothetical protein [Enterobacter hormaechei]
MAGFGIRKDVKALTDERLKEEIDFVKGYLRRNPEPAAVRGKSYVRRWGEECQRELDLRNQELADVLAAPDADYMEVADGRLP